MDFMQNRELSWLRFDQRVLEEATDETVPLLERLKFVAIFTSNLDEFFMIRVGSLFELQAAGCDQRDRRSGMTPGEQLDAIYAAVRPLYEQREQICRELEEQLRAHGVSRLDCNVLSTPDAKFVRQYFRTNVAPILSPQIVDTHHPFPHLKNNVLHIGAWVRYQGREVFAVTPVPESLPPVVYLPGQDVRYVPMEQIILSYLSQLLPNYTILEKVVFRVTRNADVNLDDEIFEETDFRKQMKKALRQRQRMAPVRLELSQPLSAKFLGYLTERLDLMEHQVYITRAPLVLEYAYSLASKLPQERQAALTYPPHTPRQPAGLQHGSILRQVQKKDRLLSYPFESMSPFLSLIQEAASDPAVLSIKITIYRLASKARLVELLCAAAENGKEVTTLIELRARFDEQNNIDWSERLEDAGCTVLYGFEGFKVHSKLCLITRRERGEIQYITQVGTGNYNEKTALQYTDLSLLTADQRIGRDANAFFKNMAISNLEGRYETLLVAPASLKSTVLRRIDQQIALGPAGRIRIKVNSITDTDIIEKLKQASCAGVEIDMVVRGICCILPGVPGKTEHLRVVSIVGRFLEHSRIYSFGTGEDESLYISSADFMTRNTQRRVEVAVPVFDPDVRQQIHHILDLCLSDNTKARQMLPDGRYTRLPADSTRVNCQEALLAEAPAVPSSPGRAGILARLQAFWARLTKL